MQLTWYSFAIVLAVTVFPAFLISYVVVGLVRRYASRLGLMDQPSERKVHTKPYRVAVGSELLRGHRNLCHRILSGLDCE